MKSFLDDDFVAQFALLPGRVKRQARKNYRLWKEDPSHPSIDFNRVGRNVAVYSVRIGIGWRALGLKDGDTMIWFWIGSHAEYDRLLKNF